MKKFIGMGDYYNSKEQGLVKVICRAINTLNKEVNICYAKINKNGYASEPLILPEQDFIVEFMQD